MTVCAFPCWLAADRTARSHLSDVWPDGFSRITRDLMANTDAETFRKEAEECRRMAAEAIHQGDKESWLKLAADWLKLAEDAERRRPPQF